MTFTPKKLILLTLSSIFFLFAFTEVKETLQASANKKEIAKQEAKSAFKETYDPAEESRARIGPLGFTGEMKLYDWFYYRTNDDRTVYMGRRYSSFPTVRYLKGEDYMEFFMNKIVINDKATDVASTTSTTLETQVLLPNDPVLHYRQIMKETDVAYKITNIPFTVKEEIVLRSKIPNLTEDLSFLFSVETTTIPEKQQDGSIAFFDQEGNYLFQMEKPFMIDDEGNRSEEVSIDIKSTRKERRQPATVALFGESQPATVTHFGGPGRLSLNSIFKYLKLPIPTFKSQNRQAMSVLGPQHYIITLTASSKWLNDPNTIYPVIIDPTISHNSDAEFNGQKNRIADSDSTSSTQLESSYGENANDPYTVLNLHFNEANGTTAGIRDYASTTRVITANGNASTTNYVTQLGMGNSAGFDGTGDYLTLPDSDDWAFGTTDFSIDLWMRVNDSIGDADVLFSQGPHANTDKQSFYFNDTDSTLHYAVFNSGGSLIIDYSVSWKPVVGNWYHLALVRNGSIFQFYVNGNTQGSSYINNASIPNSANPAYVVAAPWNPPTNANFLNGYLDSLRILKGRALTPEEIKAAASRRPYAVYTSSVLDASASVQWDTLNWTEGGVKTGDGETLYNSSGLVAQWNFNETSGTTADNAEGTASLDGTLNGFSYTASQDQATTTTGWTANNKKWGAGSLMFDGVNDYVSVPYSSSFDLGSPSGSTNDFTFEGWIKTSTITTRLGVVSKRVNGQADCTNGGWFLDLANGKINFGANVGGAWRDGIPSYFTGTTDLRNGQWHYFAILREGTTYKGYVDGKIEFEKIDSGTFCDAGQNLAIGNSATGGLEVNTSFFGIIDSLRIYKGRALSATEILSNYNAGNIEIQTRSGATSDPNDGTWEAWKPTTGETQLLSMDGDIANWSVAGATTTWATSTVTYSYTGAEQTYVVPGGVHSLDVIAYGAAGGNGPNGAAGGKGGKVIGNISVSPGNTLYIYVGGVGTNGGDWSNPGGYWGGGTGGGWGGSGGGGMSDIRLAGTATGNIVFVAGGGGGGGYYSSATGGVGGGTSGTVGADGGVSTGGGFGTQSSGGSGGSAGGTAGTQGLGGTGGTTGGGSGGGGGGGGWYGGGGGGSGASTSGGAGGGGGSSYIISTATATSTTSGVQSGNGQILITPHYLPIKVYNETTIKTEGSGSMKVTIGASNIATGTVALWHFEETGTTTGTYLYDETANNNDATTTGTSVVDGIFGKARKFNGTSDYVSAADSDDWNFGSGDFSIDGWFYHTNTASTNEDYVSHAIPGSEAFVFGRSSNGTIRVVYMNSYPGWDGFIYSTQVVSSNVWHHVAITRNGATTDIYIDGVVSVTDGNISGAILNSNGPISIGYYGDSWPLEHMIGNIDSLRITKGRALSADEIAETYRMGTNHHLTRQVSATDLSTQTKLAFWIAADRPGTGLEAMLGESDYANYELASSTLALSTTTVLYIKGDEIASSTSIKDSSFSGKAITANGNARTSGGGKIGNSVYFDGTGDYLSLADSDDWAFGSGDFSIDWWFKRNNTGVQYFMGQITAAGDEDWNIRFNPTTDYLRTNFRQSDNVTYSTITGSISRTDTANWHHYAVIRNGNTLTQYVDGVVDGSVDVTGVSFKNSSINFAIGRAGDWAQDYVNGYLDELRIIKGTALTADQIRQAYEYGLRSHQITIDFGATLQPSDLISNASDYNFSITATTSGLSATTSGLYLGDKIIIKENRSGTEYTAQGTVNAINTTTGAITVPLWDSGSSFPSGGFTQYATVFKWQREYFDLTGAATTTRNSITNLTLRPTNNSGGRTIYLDDFKYNTNYLTASSSSAITSSNNRFLQYRAIFSSWDPFVSPFLSALNTLYTSTAVMFIPSVGVSGDGFLMF